MDSGQRNMKAEDDSQHHMDDNSNMVYGAPLVRCVWVESGAVIYLTRAHYLQAAARGAVRLAEETE